ncbi:Pectate lyase, partial [Globisporangium polare]
MAAGSATRMRVRVALEIALEWRSAADPELLQQIYLQGTASGATQERVWVDHVKVSLVGRQMMTTNATSCKSLTISNSEFDGVTPYSATCDAHQPAQQLHPPHVGPLVQ